MKELYEAYVAKHRSGATVDVNNGVLDSIAVEFTRSPFPPPSSSGLEPEPGTTDAPGMTEPSECDP